MLSLYLQYLQYVHIQWSDVTCMYCVMSRDIVCDFMSLYQFTSDDLEQLGRALTTFLSDHRSLEKFHLTIPFASSNELATLCMLSVLYSSTPADVKFEEKGIYSTYLLLWCLYCTYIYRGCGVYFNFVNL